MVEVLNNHFPSSRRPFHAEFAQTCGRNIARAISKKEDEGDIYDTPEVLRKTRARRWSTIVCYTKTRIAVPKVVCTIHYPRTKKQRHACERVVFHEGPTNRFNLSRFMQRDCKMPESRTGRLRVGDKSTPVLHKAPFTAHFRARDKNQVTAMVPHPTQGTTGGYRTVP